LLRHGQSERRNHPKRGEIGEGYAIQAKLLAVNPRSGTGRQIMQSLRGNLPMAGNLAGKEMRISMKI